MNIALVSTLPLPWGGSEELWAAAAAAALKAGHRVGVWVYREQAASPKVSALRRDGASVFARRALPLGRLGRYVSPLFRPFRELAAFRPDVACVSQPNVYSLVERADFAPALRFLEQGAVPTVFVCQWNADDLPLTDAARATTRRAFARASAVAFVADANRRSASRQLADPLPNALVVDNPVNLADPSEVPWPGPAPEARLACVARLSVAYKGQDLLLETLSQPHWRERPWRLSFYGDGPDRGYLADLSKFYGLEGRVQWKGHVGDVRAAWAENEMLVLPSRSEGTPLALVEAMVCGRPAVVTDVGGNAERVEEGRSGFVAEGPTARSLGAALERAWAARDRWRELGARARAAATARLDPDPGGTLLNLILRAAGGPIRGAPTQGAPIQKEPSQ